MVYTQHRKVQRKGQDGKVKKEPDRPGNGINSNQVLETMDPERWKEGRGEEHKETARPPKEEGRTKTQGRKEERGTDRKKIEEGKMAGKTRKGRTPRKSHALTFSQSRELTAIPSTLGRAATVIPEGKGKLEFNPFYAALSPSSPPEERTEKNGDSTMYSKYANKDRPWNPTQPPRLIKAQGTRGTPQGSATPPGVTWHVEEGDPYSGMPALWEPTKGYWAEAFFNSEGQVTHLLLPYRANICKEKQMQGYGDTDPGENPTPPLVKPSGQAWKETTEKEAAEETGSPRWILSGKEEEEEDLLRPGWGMEKNCYNAHKASTNFLQEPRANQANETKEAP
jgi:hypothetical protein